MTWIFFLQDDYQFLVDDLDFFVKSSFFAQFIYLRSQETLDRKETHFQALMLRLLAPFLLTSPILSDST